MVRDERLEDDVAYAFYLIGLFKTEHTQAHLERRGSGWWAYMGDSRSPRFWARRATEAVQLLADWCEGRGE
jgi:hypothetical protein